MFSRYACRLDHLILFFLKRAEILEVLQQLKHQHLLLRLLIQAFQRLLRLGVDWKLLRCGGTYFFPLFGWCDFRCSRLSFLCIMSSLMLLGKEGWSIRIIVLSSINHYQWVFGTPLKRRGILRVTIRVPRRYVTIDIVGQLVLRCHLFFETAVVLIPTVADQVLLWCRFLHCLRNCLLLSLLLVWIF